MFTGIVQTTGLVRSAQPNDFGVRLIVDPGEQWPHTIRPGDSVAVNGCCLTHAPRQGDPASGGASGRGGTLAFDVIRETLDVTTLGALQPGSRVNLEASLTASTPMGGHFVQGHIDGVGTVTQVKAGEDEWRVTVEAPPAVMQYIVPKGSVTIEGVSLTVASVDPPARRFEVALIPTTLKITTLGELKVGDRVNLESDMIARTVVHWLRHYQPRPGGETGDGVTVDVLRESGFVA